MRLKRLYGIFFCIVVGLNGGNLGELKSVDSSLCIKVVQENLDDSAVQLGECDGSKSTLWKYEEKTGYIKSGLDDEYCLVDYPFTDPNGGGTILMLKLRRCDSYDSLLGKLWDIRGSNISLKGDARYVIDAFGKSVGSDIGIWTANAGLNQQWSTYNIADVRDSDENGSREYKVIKGLESSLCMKADLSGSSIIPIKLGTCDGSDETFWAFDVRSGLLRSKISNGQYCVTIGERNNPLYVSGCNRYDNLQLWNLVDDNIEWRLSSGMVVDAYGKDIGSSIGTWDYHGLPNQKWIIKKSEKEKQYGQLRESRDNLCLSVSSIGEDESVELNICNGYDERLWRYDNGLIRNKTNDEYCLAASDLNMNTSLVIKKCKVDDEHQLWTIDENIIKLTNRPTLVVDAFGKYVGGTVGLWSFHGNKNQLWTTSNIMHNNNYDSIDKEIYVNALGTLATGEHLIYHNGGGNDGYYKKGTSREYKQVYNTNGGESSEGIVIDNVTGLMWEDDESVSNSNNKKNWRDAIEYCENLNFRGLVDWRLPSLHELKYIIDYGKSSPSIDDTVFRKVASDRYWTSNELTGDRGLLAWVIDFKDGNDYTVNKNSLEYTRCVRGDIISAGDRLDFELKRDERNEVVVDPISNIMWQDNEDTRNIIKTWDDAIDYCENLSFGGYDDWYLPNINQLLSIVDLSKILPAINKNFRNKTKSYYWSSTTYNSDHSLAWAILFADGESYSEKKILYRNVRCVRDDKSAGNLLMYGELKEKRASLCMKTEGTQVVLANCNKNTETLWGYDDKLIRNKMHRDQCLTLKKNLVSTLYMSKCNKINTLQRWDIEDKIILSQTNTSSINAYLLPNEKLKVAIDAYGNSVGADVGTWNFHGDANQQWTTSNLQSGKAVLDRKTGLLWQDDYDVKGENNKKSWTEAVQYCESLTLGSHNGWRLPTIEELNSLVDYTRMSPSVKNIIKNVSNGAYWSSNTMIDDSAVAWKVDFLNGGSFDDSKTYSKQNVRCVRGHSSVVNGFFKRDDEKNVVIDTVNNLMWQDNQEITDNTAKSWDNAMQYCKDLNFAGHDDWYLPKVNQLSTIVDRTKKTPSQMGEFKNISKTNMVYWTSSESIYDHKSAWFVNFHYGNILWLLKSTAFSVRCVRNIEEK